MLLLDMGEKVLWLLVEIWNYYWKKKNCKNPGSESSIKYFKEHCECGDIVTGWGRDVIKPWDNEC